MLPGTLVELSVGRARGLQLMCNGRKYHGKAELDRTSVLVGAAPASARDGQASDAWRARGGWPMGGGTGDRVAVAVNQSDTDRHQTEGDSSHFHQLQIIEL